jgi:Sec-independent protein secretion pathway component TatC
MHYQICKLNTTTTMHTAGSANRLNTLIIIIIIIIIISSFFSDLYFNVLTQQLQEPITESAQDNKCTKICLS